MDTSQPGNRNKRIVKNTLVLYLRMIVIMAVNLYTVREFLRILGVVDYGIYNVVGGVVTMFAFINNTLSTSSQRYFSIKLAEGKKDELNRWFCLNTTVFAMLALLIIFLAETVGLWFVNTQLTIPKERILAANVVYQLSLVTFAVHMFSVPYNALIIAHEKMSAFAYISIVEAGIKLLIVAMLSIVFYDKLITYGALLTLSGVAITSSYIIYCRKHFEESKLQWSWQRSEAKEIFTFSGWHFFGTMSMVIRSQGINILLNMFFNPAINAARAIAYQINTAINQLSANFFTAVKPQIYKLYAQGENDELYKLINRSTTMSVFLVSLISLPVITNTEYILSLWLKEVPDYAVIFTQLVLLNGMIDSTNGPTIAAALATGKIKRYEMCVSLLVFLNLPLSYLALELGAEPTATMMISIAISIVSALARVWLLRSMIGISFRKYSTMFLRLFAVSMFLVIIQHVIAGEKVDNIIVLVLMSLLSIVLQTITYGLFAVNSNDRNTIVAIIQRKLHR